jgi:hypothetical protein
LRVIVTIQIRMLQDNFDGYWLVIKYRIIIVMFTIDKNWVSDAFSAPEAICLMHGDNGKK